MQTYTYTPEAPLSHFIDVIWFSESVAFTCANLTLPMLYHEMVINFSTRFEVSHIEGTNFKQPFHASASLQQPFINNESAWVCGLQTQPIKTITGGKHFTAGVLFKPYGMQAITGIDAFELQNRSVDLESIFGTAAIQLTEEIHEQPHPIAIFNTLEKFLLKKLGGRRVPAFLLEGLMLMQNAIPDEGIINKISHTLAISPKTLIGAFKKYIGLTPGKFHHVLVLNQALHHLVSHSSQKLTDTSYDLCFFDQAHFIHFFRKYTGLTPSQYKQQFKAGNIRPAVPHSIEINIFNDLYKIER